MSKWKLSVEDYHGKIIKGWYKYKNNLSIKIVTF